MPLPCPNHRAKPRSATGALHRAVTFNGWLRDELLTLFRSLPHACAVLEAWRRDYNEARPHSKLGWMTPRAYATALTGDVGRGAALRRGSAPRPLATHAIEGSNQSRTLVMPG